MAGRHPPTLIVFIPSLRYSHIIWIHSSWVSDHVSFLPVEWVWCTFCSKRHFFYHFENGKTSLSDESQSSLVLFVPLTLPICSLPLLLFHNGHILPRETQADCSLCLAHVLNRNPASPVGHQQHVRRHPDRNIIAKQAGSRSNCISASGNLIYRY